MSPDDIRAYLFRGLMFESSCSQFLEAGIQVGAFDSSENDEIVRSSINVFGIRRRNDALSMSRLYVVLHCFENELRDYIRQVLSEQVGPDWFNALPQKIRSHAESRRAAAEKDSWLEGQATDLLGFLEFGHLGQIIVDKWEYFEPVIPSQHWLSQKLHEMEKVRHYIAHNRMLLPSEFLRMEMHIRDWSRVLGL